MNPSTETSGSIPGDAKARMERILRLHDEVDAIKEMIREVYGEEKDAGGDKTAMGAAVSIIRKRSKDSAKFDNAQGMMDLYLTAFSGASHTHAYARGGEITTQNASVSRHDSAETGDLVTTPEHDPETGEITEPQSAPQAEQGSNVAAEPIASQPIQPETANEDEVLAAEGMRPGEEIAGSSNGRTAEFDSADAGSTPAPASTVTTFTPKPLRPYCLNPGNACGGMGRRHCWSCEKAAAAQGVGA
jgi:uncharacterized protein (UPF0335 family)